MRSYWKPLLGLALLSSAEVGSCRTCVLARCASACVGPLLRLQTALPSRARPCAARVHVEGRYRVPAAVHVPLGAAGAESWRYFAW